MTERESGGRRAPRRDVLGLADVGVAQLVDARLRDADELLFQTFQQPASIDPCI